MIRLPLLAMIAVLALASPASAAYGDYVIDGNAIDVQGTVHTDSVDLTDDVIDGKEDRPGEWKFPNNGATGKVNFASIGYATDETPDASLLYLHFTRHDLNGNASLGFVLHQSRATLPNGAPCNTVGDVLIGFNGTASTALAMDVRYWTVPEGADQNCAPVGTWAEGDAIDDTVAKGVLKGKFGEAILDLDKLAAAVNIGAPCEYFTSLSAHSRQSGSSGSSELGDFVAGRNLSIAACNPGDPEVPVPAKPTLVADSGCHADGIANLSGTGDKGSQVQVTEQGVGTVGLAIVGDDGTWSLPVHGLADGTHSFTARARAIDSSATPPKFSAPSASTDAVSVDVDKTAPAVALTAAAGGPGEVGFVGTAEPGATITVTEGDAIVATTQADGAGNWSVVAPAEAGRHSYVVRAADACGNASTTGDTDGDGADGVTLDVTPAVSGQLPETGVPPTTPETDCSMKAFRVIISKDEKRVKRVTFLVDGKKLKVVRKRNAKGQFAAKVDPSKFKAGRHQIVAKLKLRNGKTRKVKHRSFTVCGVSKCASRLKFWMPIRRVSGDAYRSATATVAGKKAKVVKRGGRLGVKVNLVGKPKGAYKVRVTAVTESGRTVKRSRTIRTCGLKKPAA